MKDSRPPTSGLIEPWGGQQAEFAPREPSPGIVRGLAAALAISGLPFAIIVFFFPPFWPGFAVWGGWVSIAFGFQVVQNKWFWSISALWNLGVMVFFCSSKLNPFSLPFIHSFTSMTVSLAMVLVLFTSKSRR